MTSEVVEGFIFKTLKSDLKLRGIYRVLTVATNADRVTLIPIPTGPRRASKHRQPNYYARGFCVEKLSVLDQWLDDKWITKSDLPPTPGRWSQSDEQLIDACPPKKRIRIPAEDQWTTPDIVRRDTKWELIRPLVELADSRGVTDVSDLDGLVPARAAEIGVSIGQVYDALHRFYAFGSIKNALLPNTQNRGAPGVPRFGKHGVRLGRKNALAAAGDHEAAGIVCNQADRQNIYDGYAMYVRPGCSEKEAFYAFSATFYGAGYKFEHGLRVPVLLPATQRPTPREFSFHGPQGTDRYGTARRQLGEGEWARSYRALVGSARDGIRCVGLVSSLDASPIDVNLNAIDDRLSPIGVGRGLFVREAWLGLYLGWYIAIGGLGTDEANLSILKAAKGKAHDLKRLDLEDLAPEDFVALFSPRYLSDNGELRSIAGIDSNVRQLASRIEFVQRGRADRNSISESGHHTRHRRFDHYLSGSTRGKQAKRGEPLAITKSLLNKFEYERLLVLWMHWANTKQRVPHLVPTEMRRAMGNRRFEPTRINIYRWAKDAGYVVGRPVDPLQLHAHLLPTFTASVRRNGLILHRPGTGDAVELLHDAHFNDGYLAECGLFHSFGRYDKPHIQVKADPDDLSRVLLVDDRGIHVIPNVSSDVIMVREGCVADLGAKNDARKRENVESRSQTDQDASDQRAFRQATEAPAKAEKAAAIAARGKMPRSDRNRTSVRANQARDNAARLAGAAAQARSPQPSGAPKPASAAPQSPSKPHLSSVPTASGAGIAETLRARLTNFHKNRKTS